MLRNLHLFSFASSLRIIGFVILLLLFSPHLIAQEITTFTHLDGLPVGEVSTIHYDEGKIWYVVKSDALVFDNQPLQYTLGFFDGYDFYNYPLTCLDGLEKRTDMLALDIQEWQDDKLILHFERPTVVVEFDRSSKQSKLLSKDGQPFFYKGFFARKERLYFTSQVNDSTINVLSYDGTFTEHFQTEGKDRDLIDIYPMDENVLLSFTYQGIFKYDWEGKRIKKYNNKELHFERQYFNADDLLAFWSVKEFQQDTIFLMRSIIPSNQKYDIQKDKFEIYDEASASKYSFRLVEDTKGNLINYQCKNFDQDEILIRYVNGDTYDVSYLLEKIPFPLDLSSNNLRKDCWIASSKGLHYVSFTDQLVTRRILDQSIRGIQTIDENHLLIGSERIGWHKVNRKNLEIEELYRRDVLEYLLFPGYDFFQVEKDIFWSTAYKDIVKVRLPDIRLETHTFDPNEFYPNATLFAESGFYIGFENKVRKFDRHQKTFEVMVEDKQLGTVHYILEYQNDLLLFCKKGLFSLDLKSKKLKTIDATHSFPTGYIVDNQLWAGTESGILFEFQCEKNYEISDSTSIGIPIFSITKDGQDRIWLGTGNGVAYEKLSESRIFSFLPTDQLSHREANRYSIFYDSLFNKMYVGTVKGLNIIDLNYLKNEKPIHLTASSLAYYKNDSLELYTSEEAIAENIFLPADNRFLEVKFHTDLNEHPDRMEYVYRLNSSESWKNLGTKNTLTFPYLKSGNYHLEIQAISSAKLTSNILSFKITVDNYFYEKTGFRIFVISLLGFIVFYWVRRIKRENIRLESEVTARTKELRKDKETIESQANELQEMDKMKSRFFANISHELRTPLTLIKASMTQLENQNLSADAKSNVAITQRNVAQLESHIKEILMLSRLEEGKLKLQLQPINLNDFLEKVVFNFSQTAKVKNVELNYNNEITKEDFFKVDVTKLQHILSNLLSNAIKFTPSDKNITLCVSMDYEENLEIKISDTGRGISQEDLPHIFERYFQTKNVSAPAEGGTGIGLALVKELLDLMQGEIKVESQLNEGTIFTLKIPTEKVEMEALEEVNLKPSSTLYQFQNVESNGIQIGETFFPNKKSNDKKKILIVEDHLELRNYLQQLLSKYYEVQTFENGKLAFDFLQKNPTEKPLILSDYMMPEMDGITLLQKVKQNPDWRNLPFIMLTARAANDDRMKALRIGVDDYLTKPFSEEELLIRVKYMFQSFLERQAVKLESQEMVATNTTSISPNRTFTAMDDSENKWLEEVEIKVLAHLQDPQFSVDFLAEKMNISRRQLFRKMKAETGLTPNLYIREVRLQKAKSLLENHTLQTTQEVCEAVGFQKAAYFSKLFQERFGKNPLEY